PRARRCGVARQRSPQLPRLAVRPGPLPGPRVVGFVPTDRHPAPADQVELVELFGPESITVPAHGWVERTVEVVPVRFAGGKACWDPQAVNRKRCNLWCPPRRNRLVARVARSLVAGKRASLLTAFPRLNDVPDLL